MASKGLSDNYKPVQDKDSLLCPPPFKSYRVNSEELKREIKSGIWRKVKEGFVFTSTSVSVFMSKNSCN